MLTPVCVNHPSVRLSQEVYVTRREVLFEGLSEQEILNLPSEELENLVLLGEPLVFSRWISGPSRLFQGRP